MSGYQIPTSYMNQHLANTPLPEGWEMRYDNATGWPYFVNHHDCSTQWQDPRLMMGHGHQMSQPGINKRFVEIPVQHEPSGNGGKSHQGHAPHHQGNVGNVWQQAIPTTHQHHPSRPAGSHSQQTFPGHQSPYASAVPPNRGSPVQGRGSPQSRGSPVMSRGGGSGVREIPIHHVGSQSRPASAPIPDARLQPPQQQQQQQPQQQQSGDRVIPIVRERSSSSSQQRAQQEPQPKAQEAVKPHYSSGPVPNQKARSPQPQKEPTPPPQQQQPQQQPQQQQPQQQQPQQQQQAPPPEKTFEQKAMEIIEGVVNNVHGLEQSVNKFQGQKTDKEYRYLEEMLTRQLLLLDSVETGGHDGIRQARKEAVKLITAALDLLELKACANQAQVQQESAEKPMEVDSGAEGSSSAGQQNPSSSDVSMKDANENQSSSSKPPADPTQVKEMMLDSEVSC